MAKKRRPFNDSTDPLPPLSSEGSSRVGPGVRPVRRADPRNEGPEPRVEVEVGGQRYRVLKATGLVASGVLGGRYTVHGVLGRGGMGIVYLAYDEKLREPVALKTFRQEIKKSDQFLKEVSIWVSLEEHPFLVTALSALRLMDQLFISAEAVAADASGRTTLQDHLESTREPLELETCLRWAIQFCHGMEYANAHAVGCHRDIKPSNILITPQGTVKITDFGLARAIEAGWVGDRPFVNSVHDGRTGLSLLPTAGRTLCGTPGYIAPEVYRGAVADVRSDIYSFGVVLWQMATGSPRSLFVVSEGTRASEYLQTTYDTQLAKEIPPFDNPITSVVHRCLEPEPAGRYQSFADLRHELEMVLQHEGGGTVLIPHFTARPAYLCRKACSLTVLGKYEEALRCYGRALEISPDRADWLTEKGNVLDSVGRHEKAISCYNGALQVNPADRHAWYCKGNSLRWLHRHKEAIRCFDEVLERSSYMDSDAPVFDPTDDGPDAATFVNSPRVRDYLDAQALVEKDDALALVAKGACLALLGHPDRAIDCFDQATRADPDNRGRLDQQGRELG